MSASTSSFAPAAVDNSADSSPAATNAATEVLSRHQRRSLARQALLESKRAEQARALDDRERLRSAEWPGAFDDDLAIPSHTHFDLPLTIQQPHQLPAYQHRLLPPPSLDRPASVRPFSSHPPFCAATAGVAEKAARRFVHLSRTDPATLTPLAASLLEVVRQLAVPDRLELPPLPQITAEESKEQLTGAEESGDSVPPSAAFRSRARTTITTRGSADLTDVPADLFFSSPQPTLPSSHIAADGVLGSTNPVPPDRTFLTSVDSAEDRPAATAHAAWFEQPTLAESLARLPNFEEATPALPPPVEFPRLLALTTSSSFLPRSVSPLLLCEPSLALLHELFFFCLLHLCGDADDELARFAEWEEGRRRRDGAEDDRRRDGQPTDPSRTSPADRREKRKAHSHPRDEVIRFTRYGDDLPDLHDDVRVDTPADDRGDLKKDRPVEAYGPFVPSRPPLLGPSPFRSPVAGEWFAEHRRAGELRWVYGRMSAVYLRLFAMVAPQHIDLFFRPYADCAAEAVYHGIVEAFPTSVKLLGTPLFKASVGQLVTFLLSGYAAADQAWQRWRIAGKADKRDGDKRRASMLRAAVRNTAALPTTRLPFIGALPGAEPSTASFVQLLQRRRASIGHSPLIAAFLQSQSVPLATSLSLPLSFPVRLSPALTASLSLVPPPPSTALRTAVKAYRALRAGMDGEERKQEVEREQRARSDACERAAALKARDEYARTLVRETQQSKYRALKLQSKYLSLKRLSMLTRSPPDDDDARSS